MTVGMARRANPTETPMFAKILVLALLVLAVMLTGPPMWTLASIGSDTTALQTAVVSANQAGEFELMPTFKSPPPQSYEPF